MDKKRVRRRFDSAFKVKAAMAAVRGDKTLSKLTSEFTVRANLISQWKQRLLANVTRVFGEPDNATQQDRQAVIEELHREIGKLHVELDRLTIRYRVRSLNGVCGSNHDMSNSVSPSKCELLGLPRSTYYYTGVRVSPENLALMRLIDEHLYLHPTRPSAS